LWNRANFGIYGVVEQDLLPPACAQRLYFNPATADSTARDTIRNFFLCQQNLLRATRAV
jgi:hypothetical protein